MPCHASSSSTRSRLTLKSATGSAPRNRSSCSKLRSYWALLGSTFPHVIALITSSMICNASEVSSILLQLAGKCLGVFELHEALFDFGFFVSRCFNIEVYTPNTTSNTDCWDPSQCVRLSRSQRTCKDSQVRQGVTVTTDWHTSYLVPSVFRWSCKQWRVAQAPSQFCKSSSAGGYATLWKASTRIELNLATNKAFCRLLYVEVDSLV